MPRGLNFRSATLQAWFRLWLAVLVFAAALSLLVGFEALPDEAGLVRDVQGWGFPGETVSDAVRTVTTTQFVVIAGVVMAGLRWPARDWQAALTLVALLILLPATQAGLKELVDRPRPAGAGIEALAGYTSPSFPAGHVMGPTVVYGWAIAMLRREQSRASPGFQPGEGTPVRGSKPAAWHSVLRRLTAVGCWSLAGLLGTILALTGVVNVYLGVHWPTDAVGGYLWGLALLLPAVALSGRR